ITGGIVAILAEFGIRLFIQAEGSVRFGTRFLQIVAMCYPFLGINFILNGIVRASGAMYQVLGLNIIAFWVLRYPFAWLFSHCFGDIGIAIGIGSSCVVSSFCAVGYYRFGRWREKKIFTKTTG